MTFSEALEKMKLLLSTEVKDEAPKEEAPEKEVETKEEVKTELEEEAAPEEEKTETPVEEAAETVSMADFTAFKTELSALLTEVLGQAVELSKEKKDLETKVEGLEKELETPTEKVELEAETPKAPIDMTGFSLQERIFARMN